MESRFLETVCEWRVLSEKRRVKQVCRLSIYHSSIHQFIHPPTHPSIHHVSIHPTIYLSTYLSIHLSIHSCNHHSTWAATLMVGASHEIQSSLVMHECDSFAVHKLLPLRVLFTHSLFHSFPTSLLLLICPFVHLCVCLCTGKYIVSDVPCQLTRKSEKIINNFFLINQKQQTTTRYQ